MKNIAWQDTKVTKEKRAEILNQKPCVLWLTGLSGSGKSTIAIELEKKLYELNKLTTLLDGDNIRHGLCSDLGFSIDDRKENIRRIREAVKLFYHTGVITLVSFISPMQEERDKARELIGQDFIEIFVDCPIEVCEQRDPKGLYKKVRNGEIKNFTGLGQGYEAPQNPELVIQSGELELQEAVDKIIKYLVDKQYL